MEGQNRCKQVTQLQNVNLRRCRYQRFTFNIIKFSLSAALARTNTDRAETSSQFFNNVYIVLLIRINTGTIRPKTKDEMFPLIGCFLFFFSNIQMKYLPIVQSPVRTYE